MSDNEEYVIIRRAGSCRVSVLGVVIDWEAIKLLFGLKFA